MLRKEQCAMISYRQNALILLLYNSNENEVEWKKEWDGNIGPHARTFSCLNVCKRPA